MFERPQSSGGAPRLLAAALGAAAVALALRQGAATPVVEVAAAAPVPAVEEAPAAAPPAKEKGSGWLLRSGGWYIRVDEAEVELPDIPAAEPEVAIEKVTASASPFDHLIIATAQQHGFDWRLIAALIFEESRFRPDSRSSAGAIGLMQVRPIAAEQIGMQHFHAPADNIEAGVKYLRHLDEMFVQARGDDKLRLVLAAYNMGPAHVRDAQTLAQRYGYDPNRWQLSMERVIPLLEEPRFNKDLSAGFAQGGEVVAYVERVLSRYRQYQRELSDAPGGTGNAG